jgi:hypothetical protein
MILGGMDREPDSDEQQLEETGVPPTPVVRLAIGALTLIALYFALTAERPAELPSVALKQELVYRCELFLVVFYGGLLAVTPVLRGVLAGLLPTEITARGARYDREQVSAGLRQAQERIDQLADVVQATSGQLARLHKRVKQVEKRGG